MVNPQIKMLKKWKKNMNYQVLCLLPGLTLAAALPAYSHTTSNNQTTHSAVLVAQSSQQGGAMGNDDAMMKKPGAMGNDDAMMEKPDGMMNDGAMMKKPGAVIGLGSRGEEVRAAQSFLRRQGFYSGPTNGIFDAQTQAAVIKFQNSKKITPTGMIGPTTRAAMR